MITRPMPATCQCGKEKMEDWLDTTKRPPYCGECGTHAHPGYKVRTDNPEVIEKELK